MSKLRKEIAYVLMCHSAENGSDTPDFILAHYLVACLQAFDDAVNAREKWYGREKKEIGAPLPDSLDSLKYALGPDELMRSWREFKGEK